MNQQQPLRKLSRAVLQVFLISTLVGSVDTMRSADNSSTGDDALCARALVNAGDLGRIQHQLARARRGENIVVGVIGGSITQGAKASTAEKTYGNLVAGWWREKFPKSTVTFFNAGIGATGSDYGALRVQRDLLSHKPDFIIVEYAVNDGNSQASAETLEGLLRQILKQPNQPAVLLLFMMNQQGANAQEWFAKVGDHYHLPMISYRDALWAEIQAGRLTWHDISPDEVHPNDRGHASAARFVTCLLDQTWKNLPTDDALQRVPLLPAPRFTDLFEHAALIEADALKPMTNSGWSFDAKSHCWKSDQPGSTIEFEIEGQNIFTMHYVVRGPMGRAKVTVDGTTAEELDAWFDQTWGGYRQTRQVARALAAGKHRVRFELLPESSKGSTGHEFRIMGLGAAVVRGKELNSQQKTAEELRVRDGLPNFFARLTAGGPVRIAYFGGSITAANGWRPKSFAWFKAQYPNADLIEINAAISGTGSDYGACRIATDVLSKNPDLVFLEHRVNGGGGFESKSVEGIVRQIWRSNPATDICLVYTVSLGMLKELQVGKQTSFGAIMETVANAYGIPSIDLGVEIAKREKAGELIFKGDAVVAGKLVFSRDGVHPGNEGHDVYRDVIARSMLAMKNAGKPQAHSLPAPLENRCWETASLAPLTRAVLSSGWKAVDAKTDAIYREDFGRTDAMLRGAMKCDQAGETITVKWHGTTIGFSDIPQGSGMEVEVTIDQVQTPITIRRPQTESARRYARFFYLPEHPPGEHTAVLRVKQMPEGTSFYAGQILIIGRALP